MYILFLLIQASKDGLLDGLLKSVFPFFYRTGNWVLPTIFIVLIVAVFCFFLFYALKRYSASKSQITELLFELSKTSSQTIHADFEEIRHRIIRDKIFDVHWREFDKSLIKIKEGEQIKIYSTSNSEDHFNEYSVVRKQLNVRLLNSVSGILVTLGLIGTFIGISAGLGEISFAGNDSAKLTQGITTLLGGAQVAFSSSVWGLILSLGFNVFEKVLIQKLSLIVLELQELIDSLFERKSSVGILALSLNEEKEQTRQLQTFNDDLVFRLGDVLDKTIRENFNPVLEKLLVAVKELTDFKKESATDAMKSMIEEFKSSMTSGANDQIRELSGTLQKTADLLNGANEKSMKDQQQMQSLLENHLSNFENKVDGILNGVAQNQKELNDQQRNGLNQIIESLQNGVDKTDQHFKTLLESTESSVNENLTEIKNMFSSLSEDYGTNLKDLKTHFSKEKENISNLIDLISNQLSAFDKSVSSMNSSASQMNEVVPLLERTTSNLRDSTDKFNDSQEQFLEDIGTYFVQSKDITSGNLELIVQINNSLEETRNAWTAYEERFGGLKDDLNSVFDELSDGLTNYQVSTKDGLMNSLQQFDSIMEKAIGSLSTGIDEMKEILEGIESKG